MKKLILIITFLVCTVSFSQYIPMLEEGNSWNVDVYTELFDPPEGVDCCRTDTINFSLGEVETVNGVDYIRVILNNNNSCLLREENGIVYKLDENENAEKVLFDFTLEVGDVFSVYDSAYADSFPCNQYYGGEPYEDLTVIQVDYIELAGELRKVITFDLFLVDNQAQWIEGIGNISGFDLIWEVIDITGGSLLVCFTTGGETYFFNNATSCDNTTLGIADLFKEKIILYPSPVTQRSILQFPEELEINNVKIYTINGRLIRDEDVSNYLIVDTMNYASGVYFYQALSNDRIIKTEKFIVK